MTDYLRFDGEDLILFCHLQPAAKTNGFAGLHDKRLKIRLTAPPQEGRANAALIDFLAKAFAVSKADIALESGVQSRQKRVRIKKPQNLAPLKAFFTD